MIIWSSSIKINDKKKKNNNNNDNDKIDYDNTNNIYINYIRYISREIHLNLNAPGALVQKMKQ